MPVVRIVGIVVGDMMDKAALIDLKPLPVIRNQIP